MTDDARQAAILGFLAGASFAGIGGVVYLTSRKWQIARAIGDAALPVIETTLNDPTLPAPVLVATQALRGVPQWEAFKRRLAYDIIGNGVVEGIGL